MDEYLALTEGYLAMLHETIGQEKLDRSAQAGEEMYKAIADISEKYQLTIQEMLAASVGIHYSIMQVVNEELRVATEGMVEENEEEK